MLENTTGLLYKVNKFSKTVIIPKENWQEIPQYQLIFTEVFPVFNYQ